MNLRKKIKLSMDATSIISAFIASSNQYVVCQNENNLMQLQRHLEILVCLTTTSTDIGFFQNGNPLASQCITHIVNLLLDSNARYTLIPRVLSILQNLSKCSQLNKSLQSTFHVHSAISVFLQHYGMDVKDPLVLQCFNLLENVTYDISIEYIESHFANLINVFLKLIDTESSQLFKVALRILSNLTRHNVKVQNFICSLPGRKQNVKKIITMLNTEEPQILVYALSILANLSPNYQIVAKLWTEEHLIHTFKIIIRLLFSNDESYAIAALDLFLDLIKVPKYQSCFIKSQYLNTFLKKIKQAFNEDTSNQSVLYLQILYALAKVPDCCQNICSVLCISDKNDSDRQFEFQQNIKIHPKIIQWCTSQDLNEKAHRMSLKLLKCLINLHIENDFNAIEDSSKEIVKSILENMCVPSVTGFNILEKELEPHISIFEILILLCDKANLKQFLSQYMNLTVCEEIANRLLDKCNTDDDFESNGSCIDLFLMVLEVVSMIEAVSSESEKLSCKILQDLRAMQFLAYALTSNNSECVKRGLLLISFIKNEGSLIALSKNLLNRNLNIHKRGIAHSSEILDYSFTSDIGQKPVRKVAPLTNDSVEKTIETVLLKIEQGMNIKELKRSEIMDLYEHKIAILTRKEQELQNYADAKTIALQKADQILTQYKCRQADSDAEALKLRTMLKDFESRCERAVLQYEDAQNECSRQKEELDTALYKVKELRQYQNEQKELMQTQMTRQYEQKKIFEEEKARLSELLHVKDCDKKILTNQLQQMEEDIKMKCKAYEVLEESRDELLRSIEEMKKSTEKMKLNFVQKESNLENALDTAQQTITALEEKNEHMADEMNKKMEDFNQQILELESNKVELKEQLKLKDSKAADLTESIKKLNMLLSEKNSLLKEAELSSDKLKSVLEKTESKNTKLEQDVKMLELLCKRYEASLEKKDTEIKVLTQKLEDIRQQYDEKIAEKDNQVKHLEAELEKHENIAIMIHQMTSGRISK